MIALAVPEIHCTRGFCDGRTDGRGGIGYSSSWIVEDTTKSLENNDFCSRDFVVFLFLDTFEYGKCLETGEMTKSLEIMTFFKRFCRFLVSKPF